MNTRLALIRSTLNMTTRAFGGKLNITGGAVTNMEKGTRNITDRTFSDICKTFNVNEDWFRDGVGAMFSSSDTFSLDEYAIKNGLTGLELDIIKDYIQLDKETRNQLLSYFKSIFVKHASSEFPLDDIQETKPILNIIKSSDNEVTATELPNTTNSTITDEQIEKELALYRLELESELKGKTLQVSENCIVKNIG